jgi:O-antigen/teichoic acid export membrane protein
MARPSGLIATAADEFRPLQAIATLGGIQVITLAAGLVRTKILALLLGPEGLGIVGVIDQTVSLLTHLGSLSFPLVGLIFLSRIDDGARRDFDRLFQALFKFLLVASVAATAIAISIAIWRTGLIADELVAYRAPLVAGLLSAPPLAAAALLRSVFAALQRHREAAFAALVAAIALVAATIIGVTAAGMLGLYVANLLVAGAMIPVLLRWLRTWGLERPSLTIAGTLRDLRVVPNLLRFAGTVHILSLAAPVAYLIARVSILSHHGEVAAGLLYAAYGLALAIRVVLTQANVLYLSPAVNRAGSNVDRAVAVAQFVRVLAVILVAGSLIVVLFPGLVLTILYSPRFLDAASFLAAFVVAESILLVSGVYTTLLLGHDDVRGHAASTAIGHVALAVAALALIPPMGPLGAAMALAIGDLVMLSLILLRLTIVHHGRVALAPLPMIAAAVTVLALLGWWVVETSPAWGWKVACYLFILSLCLAALRAEERRWLLTPLRMGRP